jgi:endonuclease III
MTPTSRLYVPSPRTYFEVIITRMSAARAPSRRKPARAETTPSTRSQVRAGLGPARAARRALRVQELLLAEYGLPVWRSPLPALDELVSTILSQNTNDTNRDRAFEALRAKFPAWEAVRDAPTKEVVEAIRPAGLANQKGPRIQEVLRAITAERGALDLEFLRDLPVDEARRWLTKFNGVGPKTAAIVLLFSMGRPAFPVDTHVHRVTGRLGLRPETMSADDSHAYFEALLPPETYYAAHLNLIRHGREVCHARNPECARCVLKRVCAYYQNLRQKR